ncbi:MAG: TatD family hydrolase [Polyangiaceae bacterium]
MFIDSHCHLDARGLDGAAEALTRARAAGVEAFVVVGVDRTLDAARFAVRLAGRHPDVRAVAGVHPHDASVLDDAMFAELAVLARDPAVAAVGEMGLDYHYMHSQKDEQKSAFRRQIALAREVRKPIVVHTREAPGDTLDLLEEEGARDVGGVIHCFSEDLPFARRALDLGFDLSFSGIVTFKSAASVHEVAAWAPADRILIETDSPYLAPVPLRGKPCEPAFLVHTAKRVADLRGLPVEDLARLTAGNTRRRFGFTGPADSA